MAKFNTLESRALQGRGTYHETAAGEAPPFLFATVLAECITSPATIVTR